MAISNTIILSTNTTLSTVPALETWASVAICFCNFDTSVTSADESITVYFVPSGGSAADLTTVIKEMIIPIGSTYVFDSKMILGTGSTIVAKGSVGSKVTTTISYMSI